MTIVDMLGQSVVLTLLGMGIVFSFLIILVISVTVVGKIIHTLGAGKDAGVSPAAGTGSSGGGTGKTTAVAAAITAAVTEYRASENR